MEQVILLDPVQISGSSGAVVDPATAELQTTLNALVTALADNQVTRDEVYKKLQEINAQLQNPVWYDDATNGLRWTAVGGTLPTVTTVGTVTTVSTVSNQTNIGGYSADMMAENSAMQAWVLGNRNLYI